MKNLLQIPHILSSYRGKRLKIGFSGGADSTALVLLLLEWGWTPELLSAVHFEHGLRGEASRADADWCREFCRLRSIGFTQVDLHLSGEGELSNVEALARAARLDWFRRNDDGVPVLLAHHADDCRENLLLKLARGGNSTALSSLRPERVLFGVKFLRPLLEFDKAELEDFLRRQGVGNWRIDHTNYEDGFHRNFLRNNLLKNWFSKFDYAADGLRSAAGNLACDADFIEQCAAAELVKVADKKATPLEFWRRLHPALLARVLRSYLARQCGQADLSLEHRNLEYFQSQLKRTSAEPRIVELRAGCRLCFKGEMLEFISDGAQTDPLPEPEYWDWKTEPVKEFGNYLFKAQIIEHKEVDAFDSNEVYSFDPGAVPERLQLSFRQGGESFTAWGEARPRRLKHLLNSVKPATMPVILSDCGGNIYAVYPVRRSNLAPVTEDVKKVLVISAVFCEPQD